jgi:hypothetical protein
MPGCFEGPLAQNAPRRSTLQQREQDENKDLRRAVRWVRNVGTDGGQTLIWEARIVVIGACTTAWDHAHSVISVMGDRFVLVRSNSYLGRREAD